MNRFFLEPLRSRSFQAGVVFAFSLLLGGCVGSQQLATANEKLSSTAGDAKAYAQNLKAAVDVEDTALAKAYAQASMLVTSATQSDREKAIAVINESYQKGSSDLNQAHVTLLNEWLDRTQSTFIDLDKNLKEVFGPAEKARSEALGKYQDAKKRSAEYPNDVPRREEMQKLLAVYLTLTAIIFERSAEARVAISDAWVQTDKDFRLKIANLRNAKKADMDKVHADALTKIAAVQVKAMEFGPEPPKIAASVDPLIAFCDAAQKTATVNLQYQKLYGFGKDSLFAGVLNNIGSGFIGAIPGIGNGKAISWTEVTASFDQVVIDQKGAIATAASDAAKTLSQTGREIIDQAVSSFTTKVQALQQKSTNDTTKPASDASQAKL